MTGANGGIGIDFEDRHHEESYDKWAADGQSKLAKDEATARRLWSVSEAPTDAAFDLPAPGEN